MRRNEWMKFYTTQYATDPKTGKSKAVSIYIGPWYTMDGKRLKRCMFQAWLSYVLGVAAFAVAGFTPSWGSMCGYVAPWYMLCLLPLFYLQMGAWKLAGLKGHFTEIDKNESLGYVRWAGLGLMVLGLVWTITDGVYLLNAQWTMTAAQELLFLGCGVVSALAGGLLAWRFSRVQPDKLDE